MKAPAACGIETHTSQRRISALRHQSQPTQTHGFTVHEHLTLHGTAFSLTRLIQKKSVSTQPSDQQISPSTCGTVRNLGASIQTQTMLSKVKDMQFSRNARMQQSIVKQRRLTGGHDRILMTMHNECRRRFSGH